MSTQTDYKKIKILGVELDCLTMPQAVEGIIELAARRGRAYYVVKPYVEHLDRASRKPKFRQLLNQADLALPDGVSLNWAAYFRDHTAGHWWDIIASNAKIVIQPKALHGSLPNYAWGTNFTLRLLEACAKRGLGVFLVGSPKHSSIEITAKCLSRRLPKLRIVGTLTGRDPQSGKFSVALRQQLLHRLRKSKPDIILVGIGAPQQEELIAYLASQLSHGVLIGEGGSFDYDSFGGRLKKAPAWVQSHGLEWLWRLGREPGRARRQLAIPRFIWKIYKEP